MIPTLILTLLPSAAAAGEDMTWLEQWTQLESVSQDDWKSGPSADVRSWSQTILMGQLDALYPSDSERMRAAVQEVAEETLDAALKKLVSESAAVGFRHALVSGQLADAVVAKALGFGPLPEASPPEPKESASCAYAAEQEEKLDAEISSLATELGIAEDHDLLLERRLEGLDALQASQAYTRAVTQCDADKEALLPAAQLDARWIRTANSRQGLKVAAVTVLAEQGTMGKGNLRPELGEWLQLGVTLENPTARHWVSSTWSVSSKSPCLFIEADSDELLGELPAAQDDVISSTELSVWAYISETCPSSNQGVSFSIELQDTRRATAQVEPLTVTLLPAKSVLGKVTVEPHLGLSSLLDADALGHSDGSAVTAIQLGRELELHPELVGLPKGLADSAVSFLVSEDVQGAFTGQTSWPGTSVSKLQQVRLELDDADLVTLDEEGSSRGIPSDKLDGLAKDGEAWFALDVEAKVLAPAAQRSASYAFRRYFMVPVEVQPAVIKGCTDMTALNFDPEATEDDGSCRSESQAVQGCTDRSADNYLRSATEDDGSCTYTESSYRNVVTLSFGDWGYLDRPLTETAISLGYMRNMKSQWVLGAHLTSGLGLTDDRYMAHLELGYDLLKSDRWDFIPLSLTVGWVDRLAEGGNATSAAGLSSWFGFPIYEQWGLQLSGRAMYQLDGDILTQTFYGAHYRW